jgi:SNF2 family DNA or RNA helicase
MGLIDRFHNDPGVIVFLISIMAGGTGLNLTGANKVVIFGMLCYIHSWYEVMTLTIAP